MKTKFLLAGAIIALAVAGAWLGRSAWRAHRGLVTLHVRHAPLADVIRVLEKQTRQTIGVGKKLDLLLPLGPTDKTFLAVLHPVGAANGARVDTGFFVC